MRCAVGWVVDVPEELNVGYAASDLFALDQEEERDWFTPVRGVDLRLLTELQAAHDGAYLYGPTTGWVEVDLPAKMWDCLRSVAVDYGLSTEALGGRPAEGPVQEGPCASA
jgi:hypothetical protein